MNHFRLSCGLILLTLAASACTGSVEFSFGGEDPVDVAVELIEGNEMAQRLGVAPISGAVCDDPPEQELGTIFMCTARSGGQTIEFEVEFEEEDRIFASPTNMIDPAGVSRLEVAGIQALNNANGFALPEDALECGDGGVILEAAMELNCLLTNPENVDELFDVLVTINDTVTGNFDILIVGEAAP